MAGPPWAAKAAKDVGAKLAASEESSGVLTLQRWGHPPHRRDQFVRENIDCREESLWGGF